MQLNFFDEDNSNLTDKYSHKCNTPQYTPNGRLPNVLELYNTTKYSQLVRDIVNADIPQEVKDFLKIAATRHIVFNYARIADFYANTTPEIQRLMEQSALVIIDMNDAIANGYVKLSKSLTDIVEADNAE